LKKPIFTPDPSIRAAELRRDRLSFPSIHISTFLPVHEIVDSLDDEAAAGEIVLNVEIEILELVLTKEAYRKAEFHRHGSGTNARRTRS